MHLEFGPQSQSIFQDIVNDAGPSDQSFDITNDAGNSDDEVDTPNTDMVEGIQFDMAAWVSRR